MNVSRIGEGLWRWSCPHPDWKPEFDRPSGWGQFVSSVYAEYDEAVVLIDPLVPSDPSQRARFFEALDRDILRLARPILILVACVDHGRSADEVAARYRDSGRKALVVGDAAIRDRVSCTLHATFDEIQLPAGLSSFPIDGLSPGERAIVLSPWRAAVFADAVIGAGPGKVRVAPPSWGVKTTEGRAFYDRQFRVSVQRVAATRPAILLASHGDPVLEGGADALDEALAGPPWGE